MHLLLVSVSGATSPTGVCRHAANIARGMLACPSVSKVTMLTGDWQADYFRDAFDLRDVRLSIKRVFIQNRSVARNFWYLHGLPEIAKGRAADIVHLAFPVPLRRSPGAVPVVVSLHDLYPFDIPDNFGKAAALNRVALKVCLQNVDAIACVSEETRIRMQEIFPAIPQGKATVVPNSIYISHKAIPTPLHGMIHDCPFLLCVAQHRANKNLPLLLRSFRIALDRGVLPANARLVMVGKEGPETPLLLRVVAQCGLDERIVFLRSISDSLLYSLYSNCKLVVAPSLMEGFGLPVAEALSTGSRVVCSDIPAFRAIAAENAIFFNPLDGSGESLLTALHAAIGAPRNTGDPPASLEPRQAAEMYLALYASLLARNPAAPLQPRGRRASVRLSASTDTSAGASSTKADAR